MTVRVLLLTEDSGEHAHATLEAILRKLLQHVAQHDRRRLDIQAPVPSLTKATRANRWKSRSGADEPAIRALVGAIAMRLEQERSFVVFHVDADATWSARCESENVRAFEDVIRHRVRALLDHRKKPPEHIERLLVLHPHYSIEAWLYQNTRHAIRLCREEHRDEASARRFEEWEADRAALDEVDKPKEETCLRDRHNRALATAPFPLDEVLAAGKSLHTAREHLGANGELRAALEGCSSHA